jgi:hypothetical protein
MGWFTRFTRFGDVHIVFSQEGDNACGIACVTMCVFKINKFRPGATAVHRERDIYTRYSAVSHATYDGSAYTFTNHLASVLNQLGCGSWEQANVGENGVAEAIIRSVGVDLVGAGLVANAAHRSWPIIVLVSWNNAGAHFVVVDTINQLGGTMYASVCDPWDGDVHITEITAGQAFNYTGAPSPFSWSIGSPEHSYASSMSGAALGWVVRRTA